MSESALAEAASSGVPGPGPAGSFPHPTTNDVSASWSTKVRDDDILRVDSIPGSGVLRVAMSLMYPAGLHPGVKCESSKLKKKRPAEVVSRPS